ncbi:MAG: ATP-dependent metallopeptidase FtsH/Yme1/Tma family protein [Eubacterium sp.]|nr:ATP-dependent metallopeptidase FtsH/Yme1/Tma family protein [Eubacterium sp.]
MGKSKKKAFTKYAVIIASFLLIALVLFSPKLAKMGQTKVSYTQFVSQVKNNEIDEVKIDEETDKITYKLEDGKVYYTNYPDYEQFRNELLSEGVDIEIQERNISGEIIPYLSILIYAMLIFVLLRMINPGGKYNIESSKNIKTRFSDVAGMEEIKEDLLFLADMMKDEKYKQSGARLPKGILFEGPPGNGKTLLARAFAGETGVNFIAVNASEFSSSLVGAGSSKVRNLFKKAKANKPCVIFIDEIDGVGSARSSDNSAAGREMNTIITALLNEIDGFNTSEGIMVIAATNRAESLDEALVRTGRFDRRLVIAPPDKQTRIKLLQLYSKDRNMADDVSFDALANRTYGCSSSEIECIVNEAIITCVKNNRTTVCADDFEQAIIQMTVKGNVKKHSNQNKDERCLTAYHEAGHAVLGRLLSKSEISLVTIRPTTSGAGGFTLIDNTEDINYLTVEDIKNKIAVCYGGRASEFLLSGKDASKISSGTNKDIKDATQLAASCVSISTGIDYRVFSSQGEKEVMKSAQSVLEAAWENAVSSLEKNWKYVEKTANLLIEKETLSKEEFEEIFE